MNQKALLSREDVREKFVREGMTYSEWARKHDVNKHLVSEIINGNRPCKRGQSHKIAVLLGIKDGVILDD